jgi:XTP/dITP diphosphohydrolase
MTRDLVLATRNRKKLAELDRILREAGVDAHLLTLDDVHVPDVAETGATFAENATLKAVATAQATGLTAVADDSGLEVAALNGMPGVLSARWSGRQATDESNLALVLDQVAHVPDERRQAAFVCVAALATPDGAVRTVEGRVTGHLAREPRGEAGFGYDPVFVPDGHDRTTAQMSAAEKDAISHRGQAFRGVARLLGAGGGTRTRMPEGTGT